jgi:hypothetical protein
MVEENAVAYGTVATAVTEEESPRVVNDVETEVMEFKEGDACILDEDGKCLMCGS